MSIRLMFPFSIFTILLLFACKSPTESSNDVLEGNFMNMQPTASPQLLAPDLLASSLQEYNGTFNPEGTLFYFTTNTPSQGIICFMQMDNMGKWSKPKIADFSGTFSEYDPLFSPDGLKLYFSSERPTPNDTSNTQTNIWYIQKEDKAWSKPIFLDLKKAGNYYSSITNSGHVYYNVWNDGDMYRAIPQSDSLHIEKLPDVINTSNGEGDPFISPEEDYLIFRGYNNSLGNGDLYITFQIEGSWTSPENLGAPINSEYHEICPYVTTDKKYFIFSSSRLENTYRTEDVNDLDKIRAKHSGADNGELNIYYVSASFIDEMRSKHEK